MGRRFSTRWWPDFSFYLDLICPYNGREFSYPQDGMLGILGILSALEKSFPGGFIHGLPRLFLDHALLWQPFGTADRREDRAEDDTHFSSLPSWSWCGWQCFVDPGSLRSGLSYIHESRDQAGSWRTRNLVKWHISSGDQTSEPVFEPSLLDKYVDSIPDTDVNGWTTRHVSGSAFNAKSSDSALLFTHDKDTSTYFNHPVPINESMSVQSLVKTPAHLTCSTTTALLFPATVLRWESTLDVTVLGPSKISVFEDKIFILGPPDEKACPILVLQQSNGAFAGLLRVMSEEHIDEATPCELIAISTGSANGRDLRDSLEWKLLEEGQVTYSDGGYSNTFRYAPKWISDKGKYALLYDFAMAFDKEAAARSGPMRWNLDAQLVEIDRLSDERITREVAQDPRLAADESFCLMQWFKARSQPRFEQKEDGSWWERPPFNRKAWDALMKASPAVQHPRNQEEFICEFYNVLWIERKDGIAYRRACGWVPKYIWEAHATGPVEVNLG